MTWEKREAVQTNLVSMGDGEGQAKKVGGLLIGITRDQRYDKDQYVVVRQSGEEIVVAGNATLGRQISAGDIGRFIKLEFLGMANGPNGKYKVIDVSFWSGDPTPDMLKWPRFQEFQKPKAPAANGHSQLEAPLVADDELPF